MNTDVALGGRHINTVRSFNGCWTCRLRRKKCDERRPICEICASLHITCYFGREKPEWMDGGARQDQMAARLRQEVKDNAHRRRDGPANIPGNSNGAAANVPPDRHIELLCSPTATPESSNAAYCTFTNRYTQEVIRFGRADPILLMFYLENVLPFLFPFYRPSIIRGGRAWILEMMLNSPVVRQATLCLSQYFFSLAQGAASDDVLWETVLRQTGDAFVMLNQALQVMNGSGITEHLHGAVRIMASIIQLQRFEIAVLSFENCQAHHNAALALFGQLLDSVRPVELTEPCASFDAVLGRLDSSSRPAEFLRIPSAEQAAFLFSSTLLVYDDIIASTVLPEKPRLYEYHNGLLSSENGTKPRIDLEATVGCQNWVLLQISEISALDAWKQQCKEAGTLDVMELVRRATAIKHSLEAQLTHFETETGTGTIAADNGSLIDVLTGYNSPPAGTAKSQTSLVTRIWAHAALLYLFIVVSGWQPANSEVRYHVGRIVELLSSHMSQPLLLPTTMWPFCVAGCLAEHTQEINFRAMTERMRPQSVFGTVYKALEIMESVWQNRNAEDASTRDLASCFRIRCQSCKSWWF